MKTLRKFKNTFAVLSVLLALTVLFPLPATQAQGVNVAGLQVQPFYTQYVGKSVTAVTTDAAFYVKYVGSTSQAATVAVAAADSDVTLQVAAANDSTVNIQAGGLGPCGASVGVLDTADTDCDTLGELVDHINASANWRAVIVTGLRADATANTLFTVAATDAKVVTGVPVLWETPQALAVNIALTPVNLDSAAGQFLGADPGFINFENRLQNSGRAGSISRQPFADRDSTLLYYSEKVTSTGAVGNIIVYCSYNDYSNQGKQAASVQNDVVLYLEAGAATTVTGKVDEFTTAGGVTCSGGRLWVRISATTDLTAPTIVLTGYQRVRRIV